MGAQLYSEPVSKHTRRRMQGAITRGRLGATPYGYRRRDTETGLNREIDLETASVVRRICEDVAAGQSCRAIASGLNADGIPSPTGGSRDGSTLRGNRARGEGLIRNRLDPGVASTCRFSRNDHPETGARRIFATPQDATSAVFPE